MRPLIHTAAFAVFCLATLAGAIFAIVLLLPALPFGQAAGGTLPNPGRVAAAVGLCTVIGLAAYAVGWFTAAEPWDEVEP